MLKDLPKLNVEDVALAVVPDVAPGERPNEHTVWDVFLINLKKERIYGILVSSKGYGSLEGQPVRTSVLRHFIEELPPQEAALVEPIDRQVFGLNNEYWVSFYIDATIYDRKYLFLPESILEDNFSMIPVINKAGVMIR
ncbi:MAG TPA: hypothetical protein VFW78_07400 [Bacteroidia bacterium]|nr:hypothetical protein [Bacteroidia bacterium]